VAVAVLVGVIVGAGVCVIVAVADGIRVGGISVTVAIATVGMSVISAGSGSCTVGLATTLTAVD
jgi:hypothetical protein